LIRVHHCLKVHIIVLYRKFLEWPKYKLQVPLEKQDAAKAGSGFLPKLRSHCHHHGKTCKVPVTIRTRALHKICEA